MGGGGQANSGQATTAANQQTAANNQDMSLSKQYGGQEQQIFSKLFGTGGGSGGTLSGMMDPSSLNTGTPTGAYKTAWNNAQNNIAQSYAGQRGSLAQQFANGGATSRSTPNGFQADQMSKLSRGEADTRGSTYTGIVGQQHQDALNNFWNANNVAAGQQAQATGGSTAGAGNAGSSSASIYGTAGAYHPSPFGSVLGSGLQAGGTVGAAAMCPATGSKILMFDKSLKNVEELKNGDQVMGIDGEMDEVLDAPEPSKPTQAVSVQTREFTAIVSQTHTFVRPDGGYMFAGKCVGKPAFTMAGIQNIISVALFGEHVVVWRIFLSRSHTYCTNGIWSLE